MWLTFATIVAMVVAYALERWSIELVSIATLVVWLVLFWLGSRSEAARMRDNIYAIFGVLGVVAGASLWLNGLLSFAVLREALVLLPVYVLAILVGARLFPHASESLYRRVALLLCGLAALAALPLWERI